MIWIKVKRLLGVESDCALHENGLVEMAGAESLRGWERKCWWLDEAKEERLRAGKAAAEGRSLEAEGAETTAALRIAEADEVAMGIIDVDDAIMECIGARVVMMIWYFDWLEDGQHWYIYKYICNIKNEELCRISGGSMCETCVVDGAGDQRVRPHF